MLLVAMQVHTSASVHSSQVQNQELKIHTCDLSSSSRSSESDLNKDMSTTMAQSNDGHTFFNSKEQIEMLWQPPQAHVIFGQNIGLL